MRKAVTGDRTSAHRDRRFADCCQGEGSGKVLASSSSFFGMRAAASLAQRAPTVPTDGQNMEPSIRARLMGCLPGSNPRKTIGILRETPAATVRGIVGALEAYFKAPGRCSAISGPAELADSGETLEWTWTPVAHTSEGADEAPAGHASELGKLKSKFLLSSISRADPAENKRDSYVE